MLSKWENVKSANKNIKLFRLKTPLGWLLRVEDGLSIIHIEDKNSDWVENHLLNWEAIPNSGKDTQLRRSKIVGGWLLFLKKESRETTDEGDHFRSTNVSISFVSDVTGEWLLG